MEKNMTTEQERNSRSACACCGDKATVLYNMRTGESRPYQPPTAEQCMVVDKKPGLGFDPNAKVRVIDITPEEHAELVRVKEVVESTAVARGIDADHALQEILREDAAQIQTILFDAVTNGQWVVRPESCGRENCLCAVALVRRLESD